MNRRQFTSGLATVAALPKLPLPAAGAVSAQPLHMYKPPYVWAAFIARVHDKASPATLKRHLNLSDADAKHVFDTLLKEGVLTAPNTAGVSTPLAPFKRSVDQMIRFQTASTQAAHPAAEKSRPAELWDQLTNETDQTDLNLVNQDLPPSPDDDTESTPPIVHNDTPNDTGSDPLD